MELLVLVIIIRGDRQVIVKQDRYFVSHYNDGGNTIIMVGHVGLRAR